MDTKSVWRSISCTIIPANRTSETFKFKLLPQSHRSAWLATRSTSRSAWRCRIACTSLLKTFTLATTRQWICYHLATGVRSINKQQTCQHSRPKLRKLGYIMLYKPTSHVCLWKNTLWNHWVGGNLWNIWGSHQSLLFHSGALCRVGRNRPHQAQLVILGLGGESIGRMTELLATMVWTSHVVPLVLPHLCCCT